MGWEQMDFVAGQIIDEIAIDAEVILRP